MFKPVTAQIDLILRDRVEHERVVSVGRMAKRKGISGVRCHLEFVIRLYSRLLGHTKHSVTNLRTLTRSEANLAMAALVLRGAAEGRDARLGISASHSEAATVQTRQPPRGFARRLNLYPGSADFSN